MVWRMGVQDLRMKMRMSGPVDLTVSSPSSNLYTICHYVKGGDGGEGAVWHVSYLVVFLCAY